MTDEPQPDPNPEPEPSPEPAPPEPAPEPPPPLLDPPPVLESLAEQVQREATQLPDSQNPADIVPNRPNIRPPVQPEQAEEPPPPVEPAPEEPVA